MANVRLLNEKFEETKTQELPKKLEEINSHNLHLFNKAYLSNLRSGTANTKNKAEVSGGGKKPFAQKGGGRARQGSIRTPQFRGGGVVFGPTSAKNHFQKINKKQKNLALLYALNEKAKADDLFVIDSIAVSSGKTKDAAALIKSIVSRDAVIVTNSLDEKTYLAFRNLPNCALIFASEFNAYMASVYKTVILTKDVFSSIVKES